MLVGAVTCGAVICRRAPIAANEPVLEGCSGMTATARSRSGLLVSISISLQLAAQRRHDGPRGFDILDPKSVRELS